MVKYTHCEKCKRVINTESYIGEVHEYQGLCLSCEEEETQSQQQNPEKNLTDKLDTEPPEKRIENRENTQSSPIEIDRKLLSDLEQKANDVLSGNGSVYVLIKEIKDDLVTKAKVRIGETFESFDINKIEALKVVDHTENILDYLGEYKDYMDKLVKKLQDKPKMNVKTAIDRVFKESIGNLPKAVAKEDFLKKKAILKTVCDKTKECYHNYADEKDIIELTKKMGLHPFNEIQNKLSTLSFYKVK